MFKFRIIGFILLMALLGGIFFWKAGGFWLFLAAAPALVGAAAAEFAAMLKSSGRMAFPLPTGILVWLIAMASLAMPAGNADLAAFLVAFLVIAVIFTALAGLLSMRKEMLEGVLNSLGVGVLMTTPLVLLLMTYLIEPYGYWLLFICLVTKATDTGGYIVGTLTAKLPGGNHKIAPDISPKKSWEGLAGGMILSLAVAWAFYYFGGGMPLAWAMLAGVVLSLGSFFGDLTESAVKRLCGVKDSGSFVPGMGGAFDVLDSFLYNGILFWMLFYSLLLWWK
ncbi:MAG: phosphatidate cytidylyltransferase [Lentisphaeria bacterium]|nr:phosphatidate cytidylyltransferase [Lentisphaeria bacterium]